MPESAPSTDHPGVVVFPPLLFVSCLLAGLLLHWLRPLPTFIPWPPRIVLAALALVAAAVFGIGGERALHGAGTNVSPHRPTTAIVSGGIYRFTRNPLYLALMCVYTALALWANTLWPFALWVVLLPVLVTGIVAREERYLEAKFGAPYVAYKARVPRWLLLWILVLGAPLPVLAQAPAAPASGPSMTFAGVAAGVTSTDIGSRVTKTASSEASVTSLRLEAGIALGSRMGVGAAFMPFAEVDGDHYLGRLLITDRQREQAWLGEVRVRAITTARSAVDLVAGAGLLRQQREGVYGQCDFVNACTVFENPELHRSSPIVTAGVDIPTRLGPHISVAAVTRVLWMRRGRLDVPTWPRDNSTEISVMVSLRVTR